MSNSISSIKVNNNIYKSEEEIAENLNTYFSEKGEKRSSNLDTTDRTFDEYITSLQSEFKFSLITDDLIERAINQLKPIVSLLVLIKFQLGF